MLELATPADLVAHVGQKFAPSDWLTVNQAMIDDFAKATGDRQWIHIDTERAKRDMPGGKTIAHGYLTLSLLPLLSQSVVAIKGRASSVNYGSNKVRFTAPVKSGSRVRLHITVKAVEPVPGGFRVIYDNQIEIEGETKPALVAETIFVAYNA